MVKVSKIVGAIATICLCSSVVAHPGEHHDIAAVKREIVTRDHMARAAKRSLNTCSNSLKHRAVAAHSHQRRVNAARERRQRRGITARETHST